MMRAFAFSIRASAALLLAIGTLAAAPSAGEPAKPATTGATAAPAASAPTAAVTASNDRITLVRPASTIEITAEPQKVWKRLTSAEGLSAFGVIGDKKKSLDKVGDNIHGSVAGDAGNIVVTYIAKESEWRAAFEPDQGNYICSVRFMLKPQGKNTLLTYADWYSDEKPAMVDQNLKEAEKTMKESLARFKALVEKTTAAGN